jgi:hypothetical protein
MIIRALTLAAALTVSGAAFAESPFVGSWKMDVAKSTFTGDTMTYTKTATGYHYSNGSTFAYDFADDGKPYTTMIAGRTATWTKTGDGGWDMVFAIDGKVLTKAHRTLSPDGSTMTTTYEEYRPDGTTVHESDVYKRVSGSSGLAGKWEDIKVDAAPDTLVISPAAPMTYKVEYPTQKLTIMAHTDGSPSVVSGPTVPAGATASFMTADDHKWTYINKLGGKVMGEGIMTVSADGAMLTDTSWTEGKEAEKTAEVYTRQ